MEAPTKADKTMLLPLAQKIRKIHDRCTLQCTRLSKAVQTELIEGLGNTYGFGMARKESMECRLMQVMYYMLYHDRPNWV